MTSDELTRLWEQHNDEFLKFERVVGAPCKRADLCAFILLDKLVPGTFDIVSAAEHDEIWLEIDVEKLAAVASEEDVVYLIRCGVRYNERNDSFAMFV
jgi:hypothetical protein